MPDALPEALLERLRRAGLSRYESLVYLGLVQDRNARVVEIARRTGVPQPKVYQAVDSLVEKGFCALGSDSVNRYRPIEPRLAFASRSTALEHERSEVLALAEELEKVYLEGAGEERWAPPIEIVKGLPSIRALLSERIRAARSDILYFGQGPQVPALEVAQSLAERAQAGVELRMVFEESYFANSSERGEEDGLLQRIPGERRWIDKLPSKMVIVDRATALLSVAKPGSDGFLVLVLRQEGLVGHCLASFERTWERAWDRAESTPSKPELAPREAGS